MNKFKEALKAKYIEKLYEVKKDSGIMYQAVVILHMKEYLIGNYATVEEARAAFEGFKKSRELSKLFV